VIPVELNGDVAHGGFQNYMLCVGRHLTGTDVNREGTKDEREVKQQSELMSTKSFLEPLPFEPWNAILNSVFHSRYAIFKNKIDKMIVSS
jgi:hypothetical protein